MKKKNSNLLMINRTLTSMLLMITWSLKSIHTWMSKHAMVKTIMEI